MCYLKVTRFGIYCLACMIAPACAQTASGIEKQIVAVFSGKDLTDWQSKGFDGETRYTLTELEGAAVLKAESLNAASGLFRRMTVDIKKHPYLNWRWRIEDRLSPMDETQKPGDDYAARIYLVIDGGWLFWKTKALNYVWSSRQVKDATWPNAFTPNNTRMIAARTAEDPTGTWFDEKRNVYEALKQWLGKSVDSIDAIAIMSDTDNSDSTATAYYGDIFFSTQ